MHVLLSLSSLALAVLGGYVALAVQRGVADWSQRRAVQLAVLAAPAISLTLGLAALHHFAGRTCFLGAPSWDYALGMALPLGLGLIALGGLGLGLVRVVLLERVLGSKSLPANLEIQSVADRLAEQIGAARTSVLLCTLNRPLALTYGLRRPRILLSTWMVEHLDRGELAAVLAHELGHIDRRDYMVVWLATVLRDGFFYLPTTWAAYRQLQREKEVACDDRAVAVTQRPLALASALAKAWHDASAGPTLRTAQPFTGAAALIEMRIARLLAAPRPALDEGNGGGRFDVGGTALRAGAIGLMSLLTAEAANVAVMLAPMGCGPASLFWKLL
ncbi:MAG: M56 family metallopeptidase [Chloroflexi bacterium]|nr:M56 family metallopeptidase [Chloroflexota bacterium]